MAGVVLMVGCAHAPSTVRCPAAYAGQAYQYGTVNDGPAEEMASLKPEVDSEHRDYWDLGYVYDAGRTVHIVCHYNGGGVMPTELPVRIERCVSLRDHASPLAVECH